MFSVGGTPLEEGGEKVAHSLKERKCVGMVTDMWVWSHEKREEGGECCCHGYVGVVTWVWFPHTSREDSLMLVMQYLAREQTLEFLSWSS